MSDTHGFHDDVDLPDGDVLVHAGDGLGVGSIAEVVALDRFLESQPHPHKIVIAGNHDWAFERSPAEAQAAVRHATYLQDSGVTIGGVSFWGSPWQPSFHDWAFNLDRGVALREKWDRIPEATDVLVTHGPPQGVLDSTFQGVAAGCEELRSALDRVRPRVHIFGHIHEAVGVRAVGPTRCINASICDLHYRVANPVQVIDV